MRAVAFSTGRLSPVKAASAVCSATDCVRLLRSAMRRPDAVYISDLLCKLGGSKRERQRLLV
jgi:hypothetical protein